MTSVTVDDLFARYGQPYRLLVTTTGVVASFTMVLSSTVANVAVPNVMGAFGVGQDLAQFLSTAFIATMTASQLLNAWFVHTFGQRGAFLTVLVVFAAGAIICAVSPNLDLVILGRVMQGFAAGIIQPLVMVTIIQVFPPERRGTAMAIYGMGLVLALGLGPLVGGLTIDTLDWRYIFFIPLPFVAFALAMGSFFMPADRPDEARMPFDWTGYALLCVALFCLLSAIANGQRLGWYSNEVGGYLLVGLLAAMAFVRSQLRPEASLLKLELFRTPRFAAAAVLAFVFGVGNFSTNYAVPVFGQLVQGLTATDAGLLLLPAAVALLTIFPFTGWLSDRVPAQYPIMAGLVLFCTGTSLLATADVNTAFAFMAGFVVIGRLGMGFISPSLMSAAIRALPARQMSYVSGTINFSRQLGGAFGTDAIVAFMERRTQFHADALTATQSAANSTTADLLRLTERLLHSLGVPASLYHALALDHLGDVIYAQALTMSFQDGFHVIAMVFLLALVPAWLLGRTRPTGYA